MKICLCKEEGIILGSNLGTLTTALFQKFYQNYKKIEKGNKIIIFLF
jgi:hypothetical protein